MERAHRVGPLKEPKKLTSSNTNQIPRQIICKYFCYSDKEDILRVYRLRREPLIIRGFKVLLFADYSAEVTKKVEPLVIYERDSTGRGLDFNLLILLC